MLPMMDLLDRAEALSGSADRTDLLSRLRQARRRLQDPHVRVLVVGELKQGKSQLVNALVNAPVCPVDDDVATSVTTVVGWSATPTAVLIGLPYGPDGAPDPDPAHLRRATVPVDAHARHVAERRAPDGSAVDCSEVGLPRHVLAGGLVLVDTPGVGGIGSADGAATMSALPSADAVLLVSDAGQEYSAPEIEFLRQALAVCPNVACVLTKTDLYPHWRAVAELDRRHLQHAGVRAPLIPVSSTLRLLAARRQDRDLHDESGFPELVRYLRDEVVDNAGVLARRSVAHDVLTVTDHLLMASRARLAALEDPAGGESLIAGLQTGRQNAGELRRRSARWQQLLQDGVTDLTADIEYDLRDRLRRIGREAEEAIDGADPGAVWDEFDEWLSQRVRATVAANFVWAHERAQWLAAQVAGQFDASDVELPELLGSGDSEALDLVAQLERVRVEPVSRAQKAFIALRGSYGGVLMFGMVTAIALGMSIVNPISVGVGVILGGRAYREDKANRVHRRQLEAKSAVKRHLDDVAFQVSKDSKDRLRRLQRVLRDHFTTRADELVRSLDESIRSAREASHTNAGERASTLGALREQVADLERLRAEAERYALPTLEVVPA
ncbi:MAG: Isoniazid-inducible protein iniA [Cellulomonadaceae bacterium]|nr:Isoniazid-inducible protein iniA [Cellulomonadaceae bacterium]